MSAAKQIRDHLAFLYGPREAARIGPELQARLDAFATRNPRLRDSAAPAGERLTERDAFLIAYGDQIVEPDRAPLQTLAEFLEGHLGGVLGGVHLLPHFPYSSDDGFSVVDYRTVRPELGTWTDVTRLGGSFRLMFDAVINHVSRESAWFHGFLRGQPPYADYFIVADPNQDWSAVTRPRTSPLLTPVDTFGGRAHVWTTFSADQMDLNYRNPQVLLEIIDLLLFYAERGAELLRLDAIAYLWKEPGTSCIHRPQTHRVVKLFRAVLDAVAPGVLLITETNVPHLDNIGYFGDGHDEAQLVYNFSLPPLVLHTFRTGSVRRLADWVAGLQTPSESTSFFNFIASHDGIGLLPARSLLEDREIQAIQDGTLAHGGIVSWRSLADGSRQAYELNVTLYDALNDPRHPDRSTDVAQFLASQFLMLSLAGVPGIYAHSLFGSRNWIEGVADTGQARTINRRKFHRNRLEEALAEPDSIACGVFEGLCRMMRARRTEPAFHPRAAQRVLTDDDRLFALARVAAGGPTVLALANISREPLSASIDLAAGGLPPAPGWRDLLTDSAFAAENGRLAIRLVPYEYLWLKSD